MTAIVGVLCTDGIVIGADSSATFTAGEFFRTIEQAVKKVFIVDNKIIIASTGQIGLAQRFTDCVCRAWSDGGVRRKAPLDVVREFCKQGAQDFNSTHAKLGQIGALVAFPANDKVHLCEF